MPTLLDPHPTEAAWARRERLRRDAAAAEAEGLAWWCAWNAIEDDGSWEGLDTCIRRSRHIERQARRYGLCLRWSQEWERAMGAVQPVAGKTM